MLCLALTGKALLHAFQGDHQQRRPRVAGCLRGRIRSRSEGVRSLGSRLYRQVLSILCRHNESLARSVADSGCIQGIVLSLQEPDPNLKRIAALALN
jgi:hypothetical protein